MKLRHHLSKHYNKARYFLTMASIFMVTQVYALDNTDLTQDKSGGKTIATAAQNVDNTRQILTSVLLGAFALVGAIIVGLSLLALRRASNDEGREKPVGAVVGLVIGGLMVAVPAIMWMVRNSIIGT